MFHIYIISIISVFWVVILFVYIAIFFVYVAILKFLEIHGQKKVSRISKEPVLNYQVFKPFYASLPWTPSLRKIRSFGARCVTTFNKVSPPPFRILCMPWCVPTFGRWGFNCFTFLKRFTSLAGECTPSHLLQGGLHSLDDAVSPELPTSIVP